MTKEDAIVAVYNSHGEAEEAVAQLQRAGFDMKKLSIVGKDYHTEENVVGYYNAGDRMKYWGKLGAFWGGIWGLLFGAAFEFHQLLGWLIGALLRLVELWPVLPELIPAVLGCKDSTGRIEGKTLAVAQPGDEPLGRGEVLAGPVGIVAPGASPCL